MVATRVSTFAVHQSLLTDYQKVNSDLADLQRQVSSGRIARRFEELDGSVERVNALENKLQNIEQNIDSNTVITGRLGNMSKAVGDIIEVADDMQSLIVLAQSATIEQYPIFEQDMTNKLKQLAALLNTNIGGRYLFSGTKTNTQPVIQPPPPNVDIGVPDDGYYLGDNEVLTARVTENLLLDYGVNANNIAFQEIISTALTAIEGFQNADPIRVSEAQGLGLQASDDLNAVRSSIELNITIINDANDFLRSVDTATRSAYNEEIATDLVAVSTSVAINESILQATFSTFTRVAQLTLADYLR